MIKKISTDVERTVNYPKLVATTMCPFLFVAIALLCWFGGSKDKVEAPNILVFFPATSFITPFFYTLNVFGLNSNKVLSSALVYTFPLSAIERPHASPVQCPCIIYLTCPDC